MSMRSIKIGLTVIALAGMAMAVTARSAAAVPTCQSTTGVSGYTVTVCLTAPAAGAVLSGTQSVTATVTTSNMPSGTRIQRVVFCTQLGPCTDQASGYLLTAFAGTPGASGQSVYSFNFDTTLHADTKTFHLLAYAMVNDGTITSPAQVSVSLANGLKRPPPLPTGFTPHTAPASDGLVVGAVGDGAGGEPGETAVANLIGSWNPSVFLYLGDVYEKGSPDEFGNWYDKFGYGQLKAITDPTVGNHEYSYNATAEGYFRYWKSPPHYYSYDAGGWHFIALDSTNQFGTSVNGVDQDEPSTVRGVTTQYDWLAKDLAAHPGACTIVYYHHPVWNQGPEPRSTRMQAIWSLLAADHVSLVLNGHDHDYQRYAAADGAGAPSPTGVTEIVAGGGGHSVQTVTPGSQDGPNPVTYTSGLAAMRLTLHPDRVDFSAIAPSSDPGGRTIDSGSVPCQGLPPDTVPPTGPVSSATATMSNNIASVDVSWQPAQDNRGVASYQVFRDGSAVSPLLDSTTTSWTDDSTATSTTYTYTVRVSDAWGNHADAAPVTVRTPAATADATPASLLADTYVSSLSPAAKGSADRIRVADNATCDTCVTYLKFDLRRFSGDIANATLRLVPANSTSSVATSWPVADSSWDEATLGWPGPLLGATQGGSTTTALTAGVPVSIDVTGLVHAGDVNTIALTETSGTTTQSYYSKEDPSGNAPQLIVTMKVPPDTTPPTVPGDVTAVSDGEGPVTLTWSESTDDTAVDHYVIYRDGTEYDTVPASSTSYVDDTVSAGTTYQYTVSAVDASGNESAQSTAARVTTLDLTPPEVDDPPVALATSADSAKVMWQPADDNIAVAGYHIYRDGNLVATLGDSATMWQDDGLLPQQTYTYSLTAFDAAGNESDPQDAEPITTPAESGDSSPPSVPDAPTVEATSGGVHLTWAPSTDDVGIAGYTVFEDGLPVASVSDTSYDTVSVPLETHTWRVDAFDTAGNHSAWGPEVGFTPDDSAVVTVDDAAYVQAGSSADTNYQWASLLRVSGGGTPKVTYVKFTIDANNALPVIDHVYLMLYTDQTSNPGFGVYQANDTSWSRQTITWNTQPGYGGPELANSGPVSGPGTVPTPPAVIDLAGIVTGPGTYSVALATSNSASQTYSSAVSSVPMSQHPSIEVLSHS